jgi:hypothetical protein
MGARAQEVQKLALQIPPEVTEVATAGTWSEGDQSGVFRATVLTVAAKDTTEAHLVLQLMSVSSDGNSSKVYKTVVVKQISDKKLPNAFLAVEEDGTENEVTWRLTSYDASADADTGTLIKINNKGEVEVKEAPKEEGAAPAPAAGPDAEKKP